MSDRTAKHRRELLKAYEEGRYSLEQFVAQLLELDQPAYSSPSESTPQAVLSSNRIPAQHPKKIPTSAHLDRVLKSILAWEGRARKRMGRHNWRGVRKRKARSR